MKRMHSYEAQRDSRSADAIHTTNIQLAAGR